MLSGFLLFICFSCVVTTVTQMPKEEQEWQVSKTIQRNHMLADGKYLFTYVSLVLRYFSFFGRTKIQYFFAEEKLSLCCCKSCNTVHSFCLSLSFLHAAQNSDFWQGHTFSFCHPDKKLLVKGLSKHRRQRKVLWFSKLL